MRENLLDLNSKNLPMKIKLIRTLTLLVLVIVTHIANAQMPVFKYSISDEQVPVNYRIYKSVIMDSLGNSFYTGSFQDSIDLDPGAGVQYVTSHGGTDIFLYSLDSNGVYRWGFSIGGLLGDFSMKVLPERSGTVLLLGYQNGQIDLDPDTGVANTPATGKVFVARYDANGHYLAGFDLPLITNQSSITDYPDMAIDYNNNIVVTGYGQGDVDPGAGVFSVGGSLSADIILAKYTPALQLDWAFSLNSTRGISEVSHQVVIDSSNNIYIAGYFSTSDTVDFDPGAGIAKLNCSPSYDIFYAKYNSSGVYQWAKNLTTGVSVYGTMPIRLTIIPGGRLLIFGFAYAQVDLNPGPFASYYPSGQFIAQYMQNTGSFYSASSVNVGFGNVITDLNVDNTGKIYITGSFRDSVDFDMFGTGVYKLYGNTSPHSSEFIASYNSNLQFRWARNLTTSTVGTPGGMIVTINKPGYILFTSRVQGTNDMNPSAAVYSVSAPSTTVDVQACWTDGVIPAFTVKPGDADNSGVVDMSDLLPIGIYYNDSSYARDTISILWNDHVASAWDAPLQSNGQNRAHADCDGNGIINADDTLAINQNFGLVGAVNPDWTERTATATEVHFIPQQASYYAGDTVKIHVMAGTIANPYSNLLGAAYALPVSSNYIQSNSVKFFYSNSVIGGASNLKLDRVLSNAITSSIIKTDHVGVNGYGEIGEIHFVIPSNYTTPTMVPLQASLLKLVDANGNNLSVTPASDTLYLNMSVGMDELNESRWNVYPNPMSGNTIHINGPIQFSAALLSDISGRVLAAFSGNGNSSLILPSTFDKGTYLLQLITAKGIVIKKIIF